MKRAGVVFVCAISLLAQRFGGEIQHGDSPSRPFRKPANFISSASSIPIFRSSIADSAMPLATRRGKDGGWSIGPMRTSISRLACSV